MCVKTENKYGFKVCYTTKTQKRKYKLACVTNSYGLAKLEKERQELLESGNLTEDNDPLKKYRKSGVRIGKSEVRVPTLKEQEILRQAQIIEKKQKRKR